MVISDVSGMFLGLSLEELGMRALASIPRDRAIDSIHAFNKMKFVLFSAPCSFPRCLMVLIGIIWFTSCDHSHRRERSSTSLT